MLIWLIRHGVTELGEEGRYQGRLDTPLSRRGRLALRQADFAPQRLYVSPLLRARETAQLLFPQSEPHLVSDLREMDFGIFEGRSWREMEQDADYRAWVDGGCLGRCPGGEKKEEYTARVCAAFASLTEEALTAGTSTMALVAHGGTQMAVLERWGLPGRDYWQWQTSCGRGWLLSTENWPESLQVQGEVGFTR